MDELSEALSKKEGELEKEMGLEVEESNSLTEEELLDEI